MAKRKDSRTQCKTRALNGETLLAAVSWVVDAGIFDELKFHGNTGWKPVDLVILTVVWAWSESSTLTGAFQEAHRWSMKVLSRAALSTYQGLMGALVGSTARIVPPLCQRLHALMEKHGGDHWRIGPWLPLAVDGSRIDAARTRANERAFCAANFGRSYSADYRRRKRRRQGRPQRRRRRQRLAAAVKPQVWLTLVWHMGLRAPWSWKSGPSTASERDHFRAMLAEQEFPENTLFCGDAGFTGYELWKAAIDRGHQILIRVGANVTLLRKLGYYARERGGIVYCWPSAAARRNQPPLVLRLIRFRLGRAEACVVTSVLATRQLSDKQALRFYRLRWGVELQFRALKQTFGRRKLRSKRPDRALVELDWSLVGLTIIQLFAIKEQVQFGAPPEQCSVSLAIRIVRETVDRWHETPTADETFRLRLRAAVADEYQRTGSKKARYRPDFKDKPAAKKPKLLDATRQHKQWLAKHLAIAA
jgi:Transposase DDE domain